MHRYLSTPLSLYSSMRLKHWSACKGLYNIYLTLQVSHESGVKVHQRGKTKNTPAL